MVGETATENDYFVRASIPATTLAGGPPPVAVADAPTSGLVKELAGRVSFRQTLRYLRLARILIPLAVALLGGAWRFGAEALDRLPFMSSGPAHHLGDNGRLDPIDPDSVLMETALLQLSTTELSGTAAITQGDPSLAEDLTGRAAGREILLNPADANSAFGAVSSVGVWNDAIEDASFRDRVISSIGEGVADEPETVSVGGKEGYLFHVNKYPSYVFGQDVIVVFYEDQIVQIAGPDERLTKLYAAEVLNSLP